MTAIREPRERARQAGTRRTTMAGRPAARRIPFGARTTQPTGMRARGLMNRADFHKWRIRHKFNFEKIENWKNPQTGKTEFVGVYITKSKQRARIILTPSEVEALGKKLHLKNFSEKAMGVAVANPQFLKEGVDFLVKLALHI